MKYELVLVATGALALFQCDVYAQEIGTPSQASGAEAISFCSAPTTKIFPGGYHVQKCLSGHDVAGIGTTVTAASNNATSFLSLYSASGVTCNAQLSDISSYAGGYRAHYDCGSKNVDGVGSNATDTGLNAFAFAELYATYGKSCHINTYDVHILPGGYRVHVSCDSSISIDGVGSTVTDAAENAIGFAELAMQGAGEWYVYGLGAIPGGFKATFRRGGGGIVYGIGSTMTAAGQDALANAEIY